MAYRSIRINRVRAALGHRCGVVLRAESLLLVSVAVLVVQLLWPTIVRYWNAPAPGYQMPLLTLVRNKQGVEQSYHSWIYLPKGYADDEDQCWPLLLYLHGSGERGERMEMVRRSGLPALIDRGLQLQMIVVSPQCPSNINWNGVGLSHLIDSVNEEFRVDIARFYVCGFSMGGYGAWSFAAAYPERVAAIVPIAAGGDAAIGERFKSVKVWSFHGDKDEVVPLSEGICIAKAAEAVGAIVKLTVLKGKGHGICDDVLQERRVFSWLLQQRVDAVVNNIGSAEPLMTTKE